MGELHFAEEWKYVQPTWKNNEYVRIDLSLNKKFTPFYIRNLIEFKENQKIEPFKRVIKLKPCLIEHHDYEALPKPIFSYLKRNYGVDFEIPRFLKTDPFNNEGLSLNLYPGTNRFRN